MFYQRLHLYWIHFVITCMLTNWLQILVMSMHITLCYLTWNLVKRQNWQCGRSKNIAHQAGWVVTIYQGTRVQPLFLWWLHTCGPSWTPSPAEPPLGIHKASAFWKLLLEIVLNRSEQSNMTVKVETCIESRPWRSIHEFDQHVIMKITKKLTNQVVRFLSFLHVFLKHMWLMASSFVFNTTSRKKINIRILVLDDIFDWCLKNFTKQIEKLKTLLL